MWQNRESRDHRGQARNLTVRGFLGFANFYRRFIRNFAEATRLLIDLTQKDAEFR